MQGVAADSSELMLQIYASTKASSDARSIALNGMQILPANSPMRRTSLLFSKPINYKLLLPVANRCSNVIGI